MVLIRLPRWVLVAFLVISVVFVITGIGMIAFNREGGWPGLLFFGLCAAIFAAQLWPNLLLSRTPETPEALLQRFPGPVELHVPQRKTMLVLIGAIVFAGVSLWYLYKEPPGLLVSGLLWLCLAALVLSQPVMLYQLVRGASLRLESDGFRIKQTWRWTFVRWRDTSEFALGSAAIIAQIKGDWTTFVIYDDANADNSKLGTVSRGMMGRNSALPDTYGLSAEGLQALMNGWRARALANPPPPSQSPPAP